MKTIETTITVLADGRIQIPPHPNLVPGQHRAVLVVEETHGAAAEDTRAQVAAKLRAAGLLAVLAPEEQMQAAQSTLTLDEARAILDRADGKPLSEIILELRGPKP
jgi:hypothetical protein